MTIDITDPAQVGERAAARVVRWLEDRYEEVLAGELQKLPSAWRRDPYWLDAIDRAAVILAGRALIRECDTDPKFLQRLLHDA